MPFPEKPLSRLVVPSTAPKIQQSKKNEQSKSLVKMSDKCSIGTV